MKRVLSTGDVERFEDLHSFMVLFPFLYYGLVPVISTQHDILYLIWREFVNRDSYTESDLESLEQVGIW